MPAAGLGAFQKLLQSSGAGVVAVSADMVRRANPGEEKGAFGEVSAGR